MAWIKFEKDLLTDPRVVRIAKMLQTAWVLDTQNEHVNGVEFGNAVPLPAVTLVCGALIRIWSLADTHLDSDDMLPLGIDDLDELVGLPGLCSLLPADWLIEIDKNKVKLPGFHEHNGTEAKKKAVTQKRVARFRARNAGAFQPVTLDRVLLDQTIPDKTKPIKKTPSAFALPDWVPVEAWEGFCEMRRKSKSAFTERAKALLVAELFRLTESGGNAAAILDQSTANGWKGVFPLKANGGKEKGSGPPWWSSNEGIQAKAAELHLESRKGESWNDLKARVSAQLEQTV